MSRERMVRIYPTFEEENRAERQRRAAMSPEERMRELAVLQERRWGKAWTSTPIVKVATWEVGQTDPAESSAPQREPSTSSPSCRRMPGPVGVAMIRRRIGSRGGTGDGRHRARRAGSPPGYPAR